MVKILDCTTRDGGHNTNWNFEETYVFEVIKKLNKFAIDYYEIGYRNHLDTEGKGNFYNCSPKFLEKFYNIKENLEIGVMTDTTRYSADIFPGRAKDFIDFVRIACHPDKIGQTLDIAKDLQQKGYKIFIQLMDVSNIDTKGYIDLYNWEYKNILESLYFADSYGTLYPQDIEKYYNKLKSLGYEKLSFHGHNQINMALENTLKAIELGAFSVDVTQNGIGRHGGNLDIYELLRNNF
ncbi:hypothetical protein IJ541_05590 [bacterium]|nr:hypothetical protein [bacterium]